MNLPAELGVQTSRMDRLDPTTHDGEKPFVGMLEALETLVCSIYLSKANFQIGISFPIILSDIP